ncbi:disulfide bond formation protein DsbA [Sphingobium sp. 22B]|uniref:DsbA family protein n=1 Tax=unclassified Sphingobium TaxID=2611147 RepID=UPI0007806B49|nr:MULTISPECIES: DsbA family protein [unclassified Sphingobium]KXU31250.1 disulfide bond formation protein DsbA [Sphingobium sp. AM]KYC34252.1 disulfide bond formation protein DsbA [Sphingobium sp. 22B]OAP33863.1 disulfide bond formation protein DsbA [Sphingobium sp. 20006FA]TKV42625.1 disulfide bond formation protein DsbA [Sphingobium sp. MP9-4]
MKKMVVLAAAVVVLLVAGIFALRSIDGSDARAQSVAEAGDTRPSAEGERIRRQIQNDPVAPTVAPQGHDVTIVFFTDYQCPFCRKMHPVLEALLREDPKVKLVYRDWPIFGAASVEAARAAIASQYQGKHAEFNRALMQSQGKLSSESIRAAADRAGIDRTRLAADLKKHGTEIDQALGRTSQYAAMMGLSGTPGLLIGPYLVPGAVELSGLRQAVGMARGAATEEVPQRR